MSFEIFYDNQPEKFLERLNKHIAKRKEGFVQDKLSS